MNDKLRKELNFIVGKIEIIISLWESYKRLYCEENHENNEKEIINKYGSFFAMVQYCFFTSIITNVGGLISKDADDISLIKFEKNISEEKKNKLLESLETIREKNKIIRNKYICHFDSKYIFEKNHIIKLSEIDLIIDNLILSLEIIFSALIDSNLFDDDEKNEINKKLFCFKNKNFLINIRNINDFIDDICMYNYNKDEFF